MSDDNRLSVSESIFRAVMTAMQSAEEISGPAGYEYVVLMQQIAREATRRAAAATHFAKSDVAVYMRPPRKGERGWWVGGATSTEAEAKVRGGVLPPAPTPNAALAEVLAEMDDGGWRAEYDYDGAPDDYGMVAVTVAINGSTLYTSEG